jgi:hypothetical protein
MVMNDELIMSGGDTDLFKILSYHVSGATNVIYENRRIISSKMA